MSISLQNVAERAGVSVKTVSGALNGSAARMSPETRERIRRIAAELGYVANLAARSTRTGTMPIVGIVADGLITAPFATDIMRAFDASVRRRGLSVLVTNLTGKGIAAAVDDLARFRPQSTGLASMYHKVVDVPDAARASIRVLVNCRDERGLIRSIVPDEVQAAEQLVSHLIATGRRRIAFLNLPGLVAGSLRLEGFRQAHRRAGLEPRDDWVRPATAASVYSDRAPSAVSGHVEDIFAAADRPDALVCGNDRVAMEAYNALRRLSLRIPEDVAVAGFDDQVEIATRLDPPLTTMALPLRAMGRLAAEILVARDDEARLDKVPFRLVRRQSA